MKPMSLFYSGMLFVAVVVSATGWYGNMVTDYASLNATAKINTANLGHEKILDLVNSTQTDMESGLRGADVNIPLIGNEIVQVFSALQGLKAFMLSLWEALKIGTIILTGLGKTIPWVIHPTILRLMQISLVMLFIGSLVTIWLRRKVD